MLEDGGIEEERRLMYVAITRARKRLYVSYAGSRMLHGQPRYGIVLALRRGDSRRSCASGSCCPSGRPRGAARRGARTRPSWSSGGGRAAAADPSIPQRSPRSGFERQRPDEHPFAVGQNVRHEKFGEAW
jgi:DNA helicase-2/ATP-dependent DNA helicase PcrA